MNRNEIGDCIALWPKKRMGRANKDVIIIRCCHNLKGEGEVREEREEKERREGNLRQVKSGGHGDGDGWREVGNCFLFDNKP